MMSFCEGLSLTMDSRGAWWESLGPEWGALVVVGTTMLTVVSKSGLGE